MVSADKSAGKSGDKTLPDFSVESAGDEQPTGRLLILLFRAFEKSLIDRLENKGVQDFTLSDLNVLRHINPQGAQLSEIARLSGLTKQAIGKMVSGLEKRGILLLATDPEDARAKLVRFTPKGAKLIGICIHIIKQIESEYQAMLGDKRHKEMRRSLQILINRRISA